MQRVMHHQIRKFTWSIPALETVELKPENYSESPAPPNTVKAWSQIRSRAEHQSPQQSTEPEPEPSAEHSTEPGTGAEPGEGVPGSYPGGPNRGPESRGTETIYIINLHVGIPETHPSKSKKKQSTGQCLDMTLAGVLIF